jgi:hypothetical protein
VNPLEANAKPTKKTRYSARAKQIKQPKAKGPKPGRTGSRSAGCRRGCRPPDAGWPAGPGWRYGRQERKKKAATTTGDKTRLHSSAIDPENSIALKGYGSCRTLLN